MGANYPTAGIEARFPDKTILYRQNSLVRPDLDDSEALVATAQGSVRPVTLGFPPT